MELLNKKYIRKKVLLRQDFFCKSEVITIKIINFSCSVLDHSETILVFLLLIVVKLLKS